MSETVLKPLRTFCCEQKLILFYNAHTDNTWDRTKGIDVISSLGGVSTSIMVYATSPLDLLVISEILMPLSPKSAVNFVIIFCHIQVKYCNFPA